jgi:hypothetical protein
MTTLTRRAQLERVEITESVPLLLQLMRYYLPCGGMALVVGIGLAYSVLGIVGWLGTL